MPKPALRIGVLTLCPGDEAELDPGPLGNQVKILIDRGILNYTPAPDDWIPFNDGTTILHHLKAGLDGYELFSDSVSLANFAIRLGIKLFVIDPLVLLCPTKRILAILIQEHVCSRTDKASCIVIRSTLPAKFFHNFSEFYLNEFSDLVNNANSVLFEYQADNLFRLRQFLKRVTPLLGDVPDSQRSAEARQFLADVTGSILPAIRVPVIGAGG